MALVLPPGDFSAYLFDCDGTIADTMPLHHRAWLEALSEWNCDFPERLFYSWAGMPITRAVELLNERYGLKMPPEVVAKRREEAYYKFLPGIRPVDEVVEHIHAQYGRIPFAVVSGSPKESVVRTLSTLGLLDRFEVILGQGDYARGKPHPDPFLLAAEKLGVAPGKCLVFEDAELGIESAQAAGMSWVRVVPPGLRKG